MARRGLLSLAGFFTGGGSVNLPPANPPVPPVAGTQTLAMALVTSTQALFNPTVTRTLVAPQTVSTPFVIKAMTVFSPSVASAQAVSLPLVTSPQTVLAPASSTLTFPINEPFTGSNGAAPGALWGTAIKSTGATVEINTNQLTMTSGTIGNYMDFGYLPMIPSITADNLEMTIDVTIGNPISEDFIEVGFRGSGIHETMNEYLGLQTAGYFVEIAPSLNTWGLFRRGGSATTTLAQVPTTWVAGDVAHIKIQATGSSIKVWLWRNAGTIPPTPQVDLTDTTLSTGKFWLGRTAGADTTPDVCRFDNLTIALIAPPPPPPPPSGQLTFAQYKQAVLDEMKGFAKWAGVYGGQAATSPTIVTNANNAGAGSLREALTTGGNRWIVFDPIVFPRNTETTINLTSFILMHQANSNITIDGFGSQVKITGFGISTATFVGPPAGVVDIANNLVLLNLKISDITLGEAWDCLTIDGTDRAWFYHLDLSGGGDGNLDITNIFAGPNANGYMSIQNCYIHDSKTGKGCLIADQSGPDASQPGGWGDYIQASSSYPGGNGGDNRITIVDSRFKDTFRNPVVSNYWVHMFNTYHHGYTLEGPALWGLMGHLRMHDSAVDGSAGGANASKGIYAETFGYPDSSKDYKRWSIGANNLRGGATVLDASGGFLNPPIGSLFTIPYTFTAQACTNDAEGDVLIARLASSSIDTQGRAGVIRRDGYFDLVAGSGTFDFTVGVNGTLQQILSQTTAALTNKRVRVPAGVWADNNSGAGIYFVNKDFGNVTVVLEAGATLRGPVSGIEMYGQILNLHILGPGTIEGNGGQVFSEGIMISSIGTDKGQNGLACGNISIDGVTVTSQAGTGPLQRNGINIWGGDLITVRNCTVHDAGSNAYAGFGSAGSGISIGMGRRLAAAGSPRVLIDNNHIYNILEVQDGVSADRNGIILDIYHGNFAKYSDYLIGNVVVSNNIIHDVSGRGIQDLCGGLSDSLVTISGNQIYGQWARRLGGSAPEAAIGGYGAGTCGNVVCSNNTVTFDSGNGGKPAFYFISFDGDGPGVFGSNNHVIGSGTSIAWENSRTNTPPTGFVT